MIIVVGVDGGDPSQLALRRSLEVAKTFGAELHVVHVAHVSPMVMAATQTAPIGVHHILEAERKRVWEHAAHEIDDAIEVVVKRVDLEGYPADTLLDYADSVDAVLVVVGTRGRGDLAALLLGSTSHRVVNTSTRDVLVVKGAVNEGS